MVLEQLTLFPEDFLVSPSRMRVNAKVHPMTVISGLKCAESSKSADRLGSLVKMLEDSSVWRSQIGNLSWEKKDLPKKKRRRCSTASGKTLKTWDIGRSQSLYQLARSGHRTKDSESSSSGLWATPNAADAVGTTGGGQTRSLRDDVRFWATPQARDYRSGDDPKGPRATRKREQGWTLGLNDAVKLWPTPAAQDCKNATLPPSQIDRDTIPGAVMRSGHAGQLNPDWVEGLMCLPAGWTDLTKDIDLPGVLDNLSDYVQYILNHQQPALMCQPQHEWEPPRVASGVKGRVPRLKMLGNGVVPLQVLPIVAIIAMIESERA